MIGNMLTKDIREFLTVFFPVLLAFAVGMNTLHPSKMAAGADDSRWASLGPSMENLFFQVFTGADINMEATSGPFFDDTEFDGMWVAATIFYVMYLSFLTVGTILMINLLIALMASTYENTRENAVLGWRLSFVRMILRKELLTPPFLHRLMEWLQMDWLTDWAENADDAASGWVKMEFVIQKGDRKATVPSESRTRAHGSLLIIRRLTINLASCCRTHSMTRRRRRRRRGGAMRRSRVSTSSGLRT